MTKNLPDFFKNPHELAKMPCGSPILVGLSGGADSSALLNLLCILREIYQFPLFAAHVNHQIRVEGGEADRDEQFCRALCADLNIPIFVEKIDVPALSRKNKNSLESEARDARYSFFANIMKQEGIKILVTAHNADDNLETQIFNLCRGCGIDGICGIPEIRSFDDVENAVIVRPILSAMKCEIIEFCEANGIKYVTDSTNLQVDCSRNIIRHRVTPELTRLFGSPQKNALRLSLSAKEDSDYILGQAEDFLRAQKYQIHLNKFNSLHASVAKRVLRLGFENYSSGQAKLETIHINELLSLCQRAVPHSSLSLPNGTRAKIKENRLIFEQDIRDGEKFEFEQRLFEGINFIFGTNYAICIGKDMPEDLICDDAKNIYKLYTFAYVKNVKIEMLSAKSRVEGDKILDGGHHKKIKKLLCDKKIALDERDYIPIIYGNQEALYIPSCAISDTVKANKNDFEYIISIFKRI